MLYRMCDMHSILGILGPSGAGKSTLILELLKRYPEQIGILKSLTTRAKREPEDELFYDFTTTADMLKRRDAGKLIQISEYAGNYYANDREITDALLGTKVGIMAIVEQGIRNFRNAGYDVKIIKIIPHRYHETSDEIRRRADEERAKLKLQPDKELVNSFEPGGKEKAVEELIGFVESHLDQ